MYLRARNLKGIVEKNIHAQKGDGGRVLVIGGAERYVGAAVLAGLAALKAGVDSVIIAAPETSARLMNAFSPDLITIKLPGEDLAEEHLAELERLSETASTVLLGPGLGVSKERESWLAKLLPRIHASLVLDADATKQVKLTGLEESILFANQREYQLLKEFNGFTDEHLGTTLGTNILVIKGREDRILTASGEEAVSGGHPRATVNGTGDVLAGIAAAFYAQTREALVSARAACTVAKRAAELLGERRGFSWLASEMLGAIPEVCAQLRLFRVTKYEPREPRKRGEAGSGE